MLLSDNVRNILKLAKSQYNFRYNKIEYVEMAAKRYIVKGPRNETFWKRHHKRTKPGGRFDENQVYRVSIIDSEFNIMKNSRTTRESTYINLILNFILYFVYVS